MHYDPIRAQVRVSAALKSLEANLVLSVPHLFDDVWGTSILGMEPTPKQARDGDCELARETGTRQWQGR